MSNKKKRAYDVKNIISPRELISQCANEPEPVLYWRGIENVCFGYVFGPSKAGKTIFCENLAMSMAAGKNTFFGEELKGKPKKVLIIAMEENHRKRSERMVKQLSILSKEEKESYLNNVKVVGENFPRFLTEKEQWVEFEETVKEINPDVIIMDSFSRIMTSDITDRKECQKVLSRLRNFAYENEIAFILIHHATKNSGKLLTMDSMAGSSYLQQEADFCIGINRNEITGERYLKDVFYRYTEDKELVTSYIINGKSMWLEPIGSSKEATIVFNGTTTTTSSKDLILNYLEVKKNDFKNECSSCTEYEVKSSELKKEFVSTGLMKERTFEYNLSKVVKDSILIQKGTKGTYIYKYN